MRNYATSGGESADSGADGFVRPNCAAAVVEAVSQQRIQILPSGEEVLAVSEFLGVTSGPSTLPVNLGPTNGGGPFATTF